MSEIKIEPAKVTDAQELLAIYKPYVEHTAISFEYVAPSVEEFAKRIENTLKRFPYLVAKRGDEIVGYAYCSPFKTREAYDWCVETSIYVKENNKQEGIGKLLYEKLEQVLARMGILNVSACIAYPANEDPYLTMDSIYFHEKLGYKEVAKFHKCGYKFKRWYDMIWMEKMLGEHLENQPKVQAFTEAFLKD